MPLQLGLVIAVLPQLGLLAQPLQALHGCQKPDSVWQLRQFRGPRSLPVLAHTCAPALCDAHHLHPETLRLLS